MKWTWAGSTLVVALVGCAPGAFHPNPNAESVPYGGVPRIAAPKQNRCDSYGKSAVHSACDEARYLGTEYTRRLSVGDEVCLEGGYGDTVTVECKARAAVIDTAPNSVKLEVRSARPDSRWFNSEMRHAWYEEGALVDLYLSERGY